MLLYSKIVYNAGRTILSHIIFINKHVFILLLRQVRPQNKCNKFKAVPKIESITQNILQYTRAEARAYEISIEVQLHPSLGSMPCKQIRRQYLAVNGTKIFLLVFPSEVALQKFDSQTALEYRISFERVTFLLKKNGFKINVENTRQSCSFFAFFCLNRLRQ